MDKVLGVPLPRGNLKFHVQNFQHGRAFFNDHKSVEIKPLQTKPEGHRTIRIRYGNVDTIFSLTYQYESLNESLNSKKVYWYIESWSFPLTYIDITPSGHVEQVHFKGYKFSSMGEEIECLKIMIDFFVDI